MSNTVVQIKRSNTTATPANLVYGELAYSLVSNNLFFGTDANTVIKIGGGSDVALLNVTPGVLTNSAALVVNSTGGVDTLTIGSFTVGSQTNEDLDVTQNVTANVITSNTLTAGNGNFTDVNVSNTLTVNGDIILRGDNISLGDGGDVISLGASVNNNIVPTTDDTFTLGTSSSNYKTVFANQVTLGSAPSNDTDAVTKAYVDNISASLIGNAISIGVPTDGIFANGTGSGNIEGAVTSLSTNTSVAWQETVLPSRVTVI